MGGGLLWACQGAKQRCVGCSLCPGAAPGLVLLHRASAPAVAPEAELSPLRQPERGAPRRLPPAAGPAICVPHTRGPSVPRMHPSPSFPACRGSIGL